jgi:hypothetical protein
MNLLSGGVRSPILISRLAEVRSFACWDRGFRALFGAKLAMAFVLVAEKEKKHASTAAPCR